MGSNEGLVYLSGFLLLLRHTEAEARGTRELYSNKDKIAPLDWQVMSPEARLGQLSTHFIYISVLPVWH